MFSGLKKKQECNECIILITLISDDAAHIHFVRQRFFFLYQAVDATSFTPDIQWRPKQRSVVRLNTIESREKKMGSKRGAQLDRSYVGQAASEEV